jgi:spermidine synthase
MPLLVILLAASGCAALIYEVVWYHLLQLALGATTVSLGILLASFMGGLCLGSLAMARYRPANLHPLRVFALVELGIGLCGLLALVIIPLIDRVYIAAVGRGFPGMMLRAVVAVVCLLPPTTLMGASLPAISRWIRSSPRGASWWGVLYGANTAGAVLGCLLAGFYLLRIHNTVVATFAAAALNFTVALVSYLLASRAPAQVGGDDEAAPELAAALDPPADSPSLWPVYVTIGISGAAALGAEVVWTRLLATLLGTTVYVFSIILAVFLAGLAIGAGAGAWLARIVRPRLALGWCQLLAAGGIAWTAWIITSSLPYWPVDPMLASSPWFTFQLDLVRCLWAVFPATLLWGASFPLALAAATTPGRDPGRVVGAVYASNTVGAILGALLVSLALIPWIGTQNSQRAMVLVSAFGALLLLGSYAWRHSSKLPALALTLALGLSLLLAATIRPMPPEAVAYGRRISKMLGQSQAIHYEEGRNSSVVITEWPDGTLEFCVNGHVQATNTSFDMKLQRMISHLPALLHPNPRSVLNIGFGAGVSAGTFTRYPSVRTITICEIEPIVPKITSRYFARENYDVFHDPRTRIVYDDARHYVLTTTQKFDIIASDPLDVFAKGIASLYTLEYFETVKQRLNPGGIFTLYVPLYESDERTVRSELATFFEAFPYGTIWANTVDGRGYDMVFMGHVEPLRVDLDRVLERLNRPDHQPVVESLHGIGVFSPLDLFATYAGRKDDLSPWFRGAELNRDRDLRLQYLAGWGVDSRLEDTLYRKMRSYRKPPEDLFTGSPELVQRLLQAIAAGPQF